MRKRLVSLGLFGLWISLATSGMAAPQPTTGQMLSIRPTQKFVELDTPSAAVAATCKVQVLRQGSVTGWSLKDTSGRTYRKFLDTNHDRVVDMWCYFHNGVEVYRDIDSNFNGRADQFRWLNHGGSRWAHDKDEDGKIDGYYILSAEEATLEVYRALAENDFSLMAPILAGPKDATALHTVASATQLKQLRSQARRQFSQLVSQLRHWNSQTRWVRFEGGIPQFIPSPNVNSNKGLSHYPTATAVVQTAERIDLLQFSGLVCVGQTCKLLAMPRFVPPGSQLVVSEGTSQLGETVVPPGGGNVPNSKIEQLFDQLRKLDARAQDVENDQGALVRYQLQRNDILKQLAETSSTEQDRQEWQRQLVDGLVSIIQLRPSPSALRRLQQLLESERKRNSPLTGTIAFRLLSLEYSQKMRSPTSDFMAVQKEWLENLKRFVTQFPNTEDTPEALGQLGLGLEIADNEQQAKKHYGQLLSKFSGTPAARRAAGAMRRLDLVGKPLQLKGNGLWNRPLDIRRLKGRVVLVNYWASWCEPCKTEITDLKSLYDKYAKRGFEVLGVSLDSDRQAAASFARSAGLKWPILFEPGGLDSPLAAHYGIVSLPTHFLVDQTGKVVSRTITISQLEAELKKLLK